MLRQALDADLPSGQETDDVLNRLVEVNVLAQFSHLVATAPVRDAWRAGQALDLFGCVYDLQSGHLKELIQQSAEEPSP